MNKAIYMYQLKPGDRVKEGIVLSYFAFAFTVMLLIMDYDGEWSILDYPGDTIFLLK